MRVTNLAELKDLGNAYLAIAERSLRAVGDIAPIVVLMNPIEGGDKLIGIDASLLLSDSRKDVLFAELKKEIASGGFTAVATMFDAHSLTSRSEAEGSLIRKLRNLGMSSDQIHRQFKLGSYTEAVFFAVETIDGQGFQIKLSYRRDDKQRVVEVDPPSCADGVPLTTSRMKFFGRDDAEVQG